MSSVEIAPPSHFLNSSTASEPAIRARMRPSRLRRAARWTLRCAALLSWTVSSPAAPVDFVREVRPVFERHCGDCHGAEKQKSGLRLDIKSEALRGGDNHGPDIIPGNAADSPLIRFLTTDDGDELMPPKGRLSPAEIETITRWINEGAHWPDGVDLVKLEDKSDHWAFKPVQVSGAARPPASGETETLNPKRGASVIDSFIDARLSEKGLHRSLPAAPVAWLRRVTFDLTGLPPSPEEAAAFETEINERKPGVHEAVVERLLASPRYGERQAQHWLDVVRFADTHGFEVNTERPNAWPYRDYVIRALNADLPYDEFIRHQIAGDVFPCGNPAIKNHETATGFLVTASVLLPGQIGQDDVSKRLARQDSIDEIVVNIGQTFLGLSIGCARCHDHKFDPVTAKDYYAMQAFVAGVEYDERELRTPEEAEQKVFAGAFRAPDDIHLLNRGDPEQPKEPVGPAVPVVFGDLKLPKETPESERRRALAEWIAAPENPLTARVMVNRVWQSHFGTGLVETPSDFGRMGAKPTHPELLDWLATEFIRSGWGVKHLHRLIVLSETYRQSGAIMPDSNAKAGMETDSESRLLWRFPSRRLEAEAIRDSMLAVSGLLDLKMYGLGYDLFDKRGGLSGFEPVESFTGDGLRRMIYAHKVRREPEAVFGAFDCPDAGQSTAVRRASTTPIQALNLFNSRFTLDAAAAFASRVHKETGEDIAQQITRAWQLAINRDPTPEEIQDAAPAVRDHGLAVLCRALFNSNEFLFIP